MIQSNCPNFHSKTKEIYTKSMLISDNNDNSNEKFYKSGFVSIIGRSNVGKSTLMNDIVGYKIAIVANKPQTTRNRIQAIYTEERGQVIFQDTPGIHKPKNELSKKMVATAKKSINDTDMVLWLVEPENYIGYREQEIAGMLSGVRKPVVLVINKCDKIAKNEVLPIIDSYRKLYEFDEIIPISAIEGTNVDRLLDVIFQYMPYGEKYYDDEDLTDQPVRQLVAERIREKALHLLNDEIPHGIAVYIDKMGDRQGKNLVDIQATIVCERESHKGIIIGKGGSMLKKIGSAARIDIEEMLEKKVNLQLFVKYRKDWRNSSSQIKNFELFMDELV